jgi:hypothetical protein
LAPPSIDLAHRPHVETGFSEASVLPPELVQELERVAGSLAEPLAANGTTDRGEPLTYTGTLDGGVLDRIHKCRTAIEDVLGHTSKEFQILKILEETDLGVCSELAQQIKGRLEGHALYQIKTKLDEAYSLALRYRKP